MSSPAGVATRTASRDATARREPGVGPSSAALPAPSARQWRPTRAAIFALLTGLALTAALTITSLALYHRNEDRLLGLRERELGLVLTATFPSVQTPLASASELANATNGSAKKFRAFITPYIGPKKQFQSVSLWRVGTGAPTLASTVGKKPIMASDPALARSFFAKVGQSQTLILTPILAGNPPSLGFAWTTPGVKRGYAAYAENPLPANRRSKLESNAAFSDLDYALYLGRSTRNSDLLVSSEKRLPIQGRKATSVVPFGNTGFTVVVTPRSSLGGGFFKSLPWIIAVAGVMLSLATALLTDRLARRRQYAEHLAADLDRVATENRELYTEQRSIAQTLQHALLPDALPAIEGLQASALYVPATSGIDVGGDWYDVVAVDDRHVLMLIGDVSGHGLRAATTMASLRHAMLAYAAQDARPAVLLEKLSNYVNSTPHDYLATVLCVLIDVEGHSISLASAGHIPPLLLHGRDASFVDQDASYVGHEVNVPIGVAREAPYREVTVAVPEGSTLVAFTDGLVERRGEPLDAGLERLRGAASGQRLPLADLLSTLARELASDDHSDDTAMVAIRWQS